MRAINQAIGRVIRHAEDYGMIFFIDKRYQQNLFKEGLPRWVTDSMRSVEYLSPSVCQEI